MVMSFWILPGLDACPFGDDDDIPQTSLDQLGAPGAVAQAAGAEGADYLTRGLLSSVARGVVSPPPAVGGDGARFAYEGGRHEFEGGGDSCFEGSNAVGSVRTILQVRQNVLR